VLSKEIAVITPYSRQVQKIRNKLKKKGYQEMMVKSLITKSQERRVIIVSTVSSSPEYDTIDCLVEDMNIKSDCVTPVAVCGNCWEKVSSVRSIRFRGWISNSSFWNERSWLVIGRKTLESCGDIELNPGPGK
jgi:superfamily I DNA and/or RNA helicase